jgi:hypothetical protein
MRISFEVSQIYNLPILIEMIFISSYKTDKTLVGGGNGLADI